MALFTASYAARNLKTRGSWGISRNSKNATPHSMEAEVLQEVPVCLSLPLITSGVERKTDISLSQCCILRLLPWQ